LTDLLASMNHHARGTLSLVMTRAMMMRRDRHGYVTRSVTAAAPVAPVGESPPRLSPPSRAPSRDGEETLLEALS